MVETEGKTPEGDIFERYFEEYFNDLYGRIIGVTEALFSLTEGRTVQIEGTNIRLRNFGIHEVRWVVRQGRSFYGQRIKAAPLCVLYERRIPTKIKGGTIYFSLSRGFQYGLYREGTRVHVVTPNKKVIIPLRSGKIDDVARVVEVYNEILRGISYAENFFTLLSGGR